MRKKKNLRQIFEIMSCLLIMSVFLCLPEKVSASEQMNYLNGKSFESNEDNGYRNGKSVEQFCYGKNSVGKLFFTGSIGKTSSFNGFEAYAVTGDVVLGYSYFGNYQEKEKEKWHFVSDSEKEVDGIALPKKMKNGAVIVQKSRDGKNWENACEPLTNIFSGEDTGNMEIYEVTKEDIKQGTYFHILVAYEMERKTGTEKGLLPFIKNDVCEYKYCMEEYEFYICYGNNPVEIMDLISGGRIGNHVTVDKGICISKGGANVTVTVKNNSGKSMTVDETCTITEKGVYTIEISSPLEKEYVYEITVSEGLKTENLTPTVYEHEKK